MFRSRIHTKRNSHKGNSKSSTSARKRHTPYRESEELAEKEAGQLQVNQVWQKYF